MNEPTVPRLVMDLGVWLRELHWTSDELELRPGFTGEATWSNGALSIQFLLDRGGRSIAIARRGLEQVDWAGRPTLSWYPVFAWARWLGGPASYSPMAAPAILDNEATAEWEEVEDLRASVVFLKNHLGDLQAKVGKVSAPELKNSLEDNARIYRANRWPAALPSQL